MEEMSAILSEAVSNIRSLNPYCNDGARKYIFSALSKLNRLDEIESISEASWWLQHELCCDDHGNSFNAWLLL